MSRPLLSRTDVKSASSPCPPTGIQIASCRASRLLAWAKKYPHTLTAFLDALKQGQQIADNSRTAVEQAMEKLPKPYTVPPAIASVMSLETYPLNVAPNIDLPRVQRVANEMFQFHMLTQPFQVSTMLGAP